MTMKIGLFGFNNGPLGTPENISSVLQCAEAAGFESAWTGEHVVAISPQEPPSPIAPEFPMLDTVASLAFAAGQTKTLKLGSGIILLAQRNPVVLAKELSSIDVLSNGRLLFGIGVGYVEREFEVIGVPYEERGPRVDDHIEAIRALWTQEEPNFDGQFSKIHGIKQKPSPIQQPHPPIIIGGMSNVAYRRAITHGNGWYGFNQSEDEAAASIAGLREAAAKQNAPEKFDALEVSVTPRGPITAERVARFQELGVSRLMLLPQPASDAGSLADGMRAYIETTAKELKL